MKNVSAVLAVIALAACASAGNMKMKDESQATVYARIVESKTTQAEVQAAYGLPTNKSFTDGGNEIWTYDYAYATPKAVNFVPIVGIFAGGADVTKKQLVLLFDKGGVVVRRTYTESQQEVVRGAAPNQQAPK
ncbi:MAG TPA: hypothetical protein VGK75_06365 [Casimicrobiaceae bacterium]|jgi:outer membrane protein assembly factor BamE (lipoprotein component of BamABCDE complex)